MAVSQKLKSTRTLHIVLWTYTNTVAKKFSSYQNRGTNQMSYSKLLRATKSIKIIQKMKNYLEVA